VLLHFLSTFYNSLYQKAFFYVDPYQFVTKVSQKICAPQQPHDRGYAESREQAMADFKMAWQRKSVVVRKTRATVPPLPGFAESSFSLAASCF
jgi:hypothetical protein